MAHDKSRRFFQKSKDLQILDVGIYFAIFSRKNDAILLLKSGQKSK